ncbi:LysR family transcriptional regulator [Phycicoccus endophyticus]|uniref:LysR family transcriptional regulator n=1 Tax=Phycicoccus endophyticus TaxID=1690220 RepID=A0A7G9QZD6_9MICO|nr:LysR substrate-binding domain-containing protein [Phycicoccus endophyticus]NHI19068.1 LysR family transcriptional regulator [Phycicoccus endophyticus]QNN48711.1 LysR family transcriptional regulator [Phycicoccus endophyticus]GGL32577.1 LysR family transcriptional regulator [Phycicoccus endophyticus]
MELRQLVAAVTVADVGSVSNAARRLHLAQPALTRRIQALEKDLGVSIFDRTPSGMRPTATGEAFLARARLILRDAERARVEAGHGAGEVAGQVSVGLLASISELLGPDLAEAVRSAHPAVRLRVDIGYSGHVRQWLEAGAVDVAVLYELGDRPGIHSDPLVRERLVVAGPADSVLAQQDQVDIAALPGPFVLPAQEHALRILVDEAFAAAGATARVALETNTVDMQKTLAHRALGWTVLPASCIAQDVASGRLASAEIHPPVERTLVIAHTALHPSRAVTTVADALREVVERVIGRGAWPSAQLIDGRTRR